MADAVESNGQGGAGVCLEPIHTPEPTAYHLPRRQNLFHPQSIRLLLFFCSNTLPASFLTVPSSPSPSDPDSLHSVSQSMNVMPTDDTTTKPIVHIHTQQQHDTPLGPNGRAPPRPRYAGPSPAPPKNCPGGGGRGRGGTCLNPPRYPPLPLPPRPPGPGIAALENRQNVLDLDPRYPRPSPVLQC